MCGEAISERSLRHPGWRVVAVCFAVAIFSWGFAFYGHGVYLAELSRLHGWSAAAISGATTLSYLVSASLVIFVSDVLARFGPRRFLLLAIACMAASAALLTTVTQIWHLMAVYVLMAFGWAGMGVAAITTILGNWFGERRGLAISLALNGASLSGVIFIPPLVALSGAYGFRPAMLTCTAIMLAVLLPMVVFLFPEGRRSDAPTGEGAGILALPSWSKAQALLSWRFWSVTTPFALAIAAQAGFLVHQIAYMAPLIGREQAALAVAVTTACAVIGRLCLGFVIHRLDQRIVSAVSFASQTAALCVMAASDAAPVLLAACAVYGFSVGNIITLPALIIQREFEPASFGAMVGLSTAVGQFIYAFGPGLLGVVKDASGGYTLPLILCGAFNLLAAIIILMRPRSTAASH